MKRLLFCLALLTTVPAARASVNLVDKDDWKVDFSGFVEMDMINDDTRSFTEVIGNAPVGNSQSKALAMPQGQRTLFSMRNSRLAFNVQAPKYEDIKSRGYFEMDFLGYDPSMSSGTSTPTSSDASNINNPTLRIRHAYIASDTDSWHFLAGQTWAMFGWQPYYFMPTLQVAPVTGMLYSRTPQLRVVKDLSLSDDSMLQLALGIMRPPQRDSGTPAVEAGARWALNSWSAAYTGGATGGHKPQPLSVGISGTARQFEVPNDPSNVNSDKSMKTGSAVAIDTLIPIIPSSDGKSSSNNLVLGGEFTTGQGDGDEFVNWTGGQKSPINSGATNALMNLDGGIGGFMGKDFDLIKVQTWNAYLQYHLPEDWHTWIGAGYGQIYSANIANFYGTLSNLAFADAYFQDEIYFANIAHDCTDHIRTGLEYANVKTSYLDGTKTTDNRVQLSAWFIF